jgi:hypothetical protein
MNIEMSFEWLVNQARLVLDRNQSANWVSEAPGRDTGVLTIRRGLYGRVHVLWSQDHNWNCPTLITFENLGPGEATKFRLGNSREALWRDMDYTPRGSEEWVMTCNLTVMGPCSWVDSKATFSDVVSMAQDSFLLGTDFLLGAEPVVRVDILDSKLGPGTLVMTSEFVAVPASGVGTGDGVVSRVMFVPEEFTPGVEPLFELFRSGTFTVGRGDRSKGLVENIDRIDVAKMLDSYTQPMALDALELVESMVLARRPVSGDLMGWGDDPFDLGVGGI